MEESGINLAMLHKDLALWLQDQGLPARIWFTKYPELLPAN
jgi:hypothetical protein